MSAWMINWGAGILMAMAAVLAVAGVLGDALRRRFRRRRRCPRCRYNMSATPALTCNECGFQARRERQLWRGRRSWRLVALGIGCLLAAHGLKVSPQVKKNGWWAVVPTWSVILSVPLLEPDRRGYDRLLDQQARGVSGGAGPPISLSDRLAVEAERRVGRKDLPWWDVRLFRWVTDPPPRGREGRRHEWRSPRDRLLGSLCWRDGWRVKWKDVAPDQSAGLRIRTRSRWPIGHPIYGTVAMIWDRRPDLTVEVRARPQCAGLVPISRFGESPGFIDCFTERRWSDDLVALTDGTERAGPLRYDLEVVQSEWSISSPRLARRVIFSAGTLELPVGRVADVHEILSPVRSAGIKRYLEQHVAAHVLLQQDGLMTRLLFVPWSTSAPPDFPAGVTVGLSLTLLAGDTEIASGVAWFLSDDLPAMTITLLPVTCRRELMMRELHQHELSLRLHGDPLVALRNFESDRYWQGDITVPARVVRLDEIDRRNHLMSCGEQVYGTRRILHRRGDAIPADVAAEAEAAVRGLIDEVRKGETGAITAASGRLTLALREIRDLRENMRRRASPVSRSSEGAASSTPAESP